MHEGSCVSRIVLGLALTSCVGKQPSFREPPPTSYSATRLQLEMEGASPTQVAGAEVTADFFRSAEVRPLLGRLMIGPEYERAEVAVTVLSHHCWQEQFLSTPAVICGSDLHLYNGWIPTMQARRCVGARVHGRGRRGGVARSRICGVAIESSSRFRSRADTATCCEKELYSLCENSNPNAWMAEKLWGYSPSGLFGYSHMLGGYPGRSGGIRTSTLRRCRPDQGARRT